MEAVALYTFRATEGDELSFNKGDMLKVRSIFGSCHSRFLFGNGPFVLFVFFAPLHCGEEFCPLAKLTVNTDSLISTQHRRTFYHTSLCFSLIRSVKSADSVDSKQNNVSVKSSLTAQLLY